MKGFTAALVEDTCQTSNTLYGAWVSDEIAYFTFLCKLPPHETCSFNLPSFIDSLRIYLDECFLSPFCSPDVKRCRVPYNRHGNIHKCCQTSLKMTLVLRGKIQCVCAFIYSYKISFFTFFSCKGFVYWLSALYKPIAWIIAKFYVWVFPSYKVTRDVCRSSLIRDVLYSK